MPAAISEEIKEKAKVIAIQVGYREAARQLELNEDTVCTWAYREGWSDQVKAAQAAIVTKHANQGVKASASIGAVDVLSKLGGKTRLGYAKVLHKTAKHLQSLDPEELVLLHQVVKSNVDSSDKVFSWSQGQPATQVNVQVVNNQVIPDA